MSFPSRIVGALVCAVLFLESCDDNVSCVFTTGCSEVTGALSGNPAALPVDGQWIVDGAPRIERVSPTGSTNSGTTPVVLVFSESMIPETLEAAFEIVLEGAPSAIRGVLQALVADGRVLVLLPVPQPPLAAGTYSVRLAEGAVVTDLTGQKLGVAAGESVGSFTVSSSPSAAPRLVTTFPPDGATAQSETSQIVVVLDRPVVQATVDSDSFDVRAGGVDPANDSPPAPLVPDGTTVADPRVFLYRSVDAAGVAAPLGTNVAVELSLSPAGAPIREADNGILPPSTITFRTLTFAVPVVARLGSRPPDAIGRANLTDGDPEELRLEVDLVGGEPGDAVDLILTGNKRSDDASDRPLIALQRSVALSGAAPITLATFTREVIDLQFSSDPGDTRFQDGPISFALRTRRGSQVTPVRVLDLDLDPDVIQDPVLDTTVPRVVSLVRPGLVTNLFRSDQRGISLAGVATETLRSVEVTTPLGNTVKPVAGSAGTTPTTILFLAAPIPAGILATGTSTYSLVGRDVAFNPSIVHSGDFTQLGAVGPGAFAPGQTIDVEVFDKNSLAPVAGAQVLVHSDQGDGTFPFFVAGTTLGDGRVSVATAGAPSVGAIVTVVHAGHDLFTLHGVTSTRLSVPLHPTTGLPADATGIALSGDDRVIADLPDRERRFDDSRRPVELARGFRGQGPVLGAGSVSFAYGPEPIREEQLGMRSFFAGDFAQSKGGFSTTQLLLSFALLLPLAPTPSAGTQDSDLEVPALLTDPGTPAADRVQGLQCVFTIDANAGVDLLDLEDDTATTGTPFVSVETRVAGLGGVIAVAAGLAFDQGSNSWDVRAAVPGAISAAGSLGVQGSVDTDPSLRMELRDADGNVAGARPRLSDIPAVGPPVFRALATAALQAPVPGAHTGGNAFDLVLDHAIGDERGMGGLYRVELQDENGRGWTLWRVDASGTGDVALRVVDVADGGALGLSDGTLSAAAAAFAWKSFSETAFLWSDVEREFELFSFAAPTSFVKP